jgi:VanZ family protein
MGGEMGLTGVRARIPAALCFLVLCGILLAGLLPFRGPRNGATWLAGQNGVRLSGHSTLWSSGPFPPVNAGNGAGCSLELWLQPDLPHESNAILSFSTVDNPLQLTLHQYRSLFILNTGRPRSRHPASTIGIDGAFHQGTPAFLTITSGPQQTAMYSGGALARIFPQARIAGDCAGQLVIGTSPVFDTPWRGQLKGLAIYGQELDPDQVRRHYETWTTQGQPELSDAERPVALYFFNEHSGNVVHNAVAGGLDLYIPPRYVLFHQILLEPFWQEYRPRWSYVEDCLINILGFMPLGFFFYAYWTSTRPIKRAALVATVFGLAVSLTIEVLQSFIPVRDSGTTDLMTNTFGTFLGVRLAGWSVARSLLARIYSVGLRR